MARDRTEKFKELAEGRLERTVKQIDLIGNLADTSNYKYTDEQVAEIFLSLGEAIDRCRDRFLDKGH